jgi:hypothetical protein
MMKSAPMFERANHLRCQENRKTEGTVDGDRHEKIRSRARGCGVRGARYF